uniref:Uncharacterized protein At1g08160 n=1 Tax=Anthurium amnicola TaxID=1678845 RepID=A0A1D1ZH59_9ARAE
MAPPPGVGTRRRPGFGVLRCAAITALALVVAVGLAVLIIWFVIRPAPLEYVVDDARVRGFGLGGGRLNATFDLVIWADNRNNKVAVYYDSMEVRVVYDDQAVAVAQVAPFFHPHHNGTVIKVAAAAHSVPVGEATATATDLRRGRASGKLAVIVEVRARIRFRIASFKSKHYTMRVYCSPVDVFFSQSRRGERTDCDVDI